jgi:acyl-coenzyme A synthetase/AMP-(fatty) acid ligase
LIELVIESLNEMWAPHSVEFVEALPRNRSAKVDKQALRAAWAARAALPADERSNRATSRSG